MNFFIRQSMSKGVTSAVLQSMIKAVTFCAVGASLIGIGTMAPAAFALTTEQVSAKLSRVPVYVIGSDEGLVLISADREGEATEPSLFVFMTEQDATTFLTQANAKNPEFAPDAEVALTSLEKLYQETQANSEQPLRLTYFPEANEVSQASEINDEYVGGVPLFYAQFEDGSLVPVPQGDEGAIYPLFFSSADLQAQLDALAAENPEARAAISIGVLPLEVMIQEMQTEDYETPQKIELLPDSETINAIRQSSPPAQNPPAQ